MRTSALKYTILSLASILTMAIFMLVPFQGFLTVWAAHLFGHYTLFRLWDEALLGIATIGVIYLFFTDRKIRFNTLSRRVVWIIFTYIALSIILGILAYLNHTVTKKSLGYGLIINLRYPIFFLVTWAIALRLARLRRHWHWLVIWPSLVVIVFGLLQIFVLPNDFLKHFGYGPNTIPVVETINNNSHYLRFASTLRGANPLGAYLIIPISLFTLMLIRPKRTIRDAWLLIGAAILLFYCFSRSAWIGAGISVVIVLLTSKLAAKTQRLAATIVVALVVLGALATLSLHNNTRFQNFVFHTQNHSAVNTTSNDNHAVAIKAGIKDVIQHPFGQGPGTAGPASVYNNGKTKIAENYYIQIAQETGIIGLVLFLMINLGVGYLLWIRRDDTLALSLFASLIGISFVCLLSHAWADDTLAYLWWGLAGVAMAPNKLLEKPKVSVDHSKLDA